MRTYTRTLIRRRLQPGFLLCRLGTGTGWCGSGLRTGTGGHRIRQMTRGLYRYARLQGFNVRLAEHENRVSWSRLAANLDGFLAIHDFSLKQASVQPIHGLAHVNRITMEGDLRGGGILGEQGGCGAYGNFLLLRALLNLLKGKSRP